MFVTRHAKTPLNDRQRTIRPEPLCFSAYGLSVAMFKNVRIRNGPRFDECRVPEKPRFIEAIIPVVCGNHRLRLSAE